MSAFTSEQIERGRLADEVQKHRLAWRDAKRAFADGRITEADLVAVGALLDDAEGQLAAFNANHPQTDR